MVLVTLLGMTTGAFARLGWVTVITLASMLFGETMRICMFLLHILVVNDPDTLQSVRPSVMQVSRPGQFVRVMIEYMPMTLVVSEVCSNGSALCTRTNGVWVPAVTMVLNRLAVTFLRGFVRMTLVPPMRTLRLFLLVMVCMSERTDRLSTRL